MSFGSYRVADRVPLGQPEDGPYLTVLVAITYKIYNKSPKPEVFPSEDTDWEPYFENAVHIQGWSDRFKTVTIEGCVEDKGYKANAVYPLNPLSTVVGKDGVTRRLMNFGKFKVDSGDKPARVSYAYELVKRVDDCHSWLTTTPIEKFRVSTDDRTSKKLQFHVETVSRGKARRTDASEDLHFWDLEESMLPNQGVIIYWYPLKTGQDAVPRPVEGK